MKTMSALHDLPLVTTIAAGIGMAFACGFVATKLRISPLVGYVLAGVIVGPHSPGFVADIHIAEQLSEIGVVLLLFGVGLHFSIEDFMEVRKIASFGAILRIAIITMAGVGLAGFMGWSVGTGLLFGLALSVASTVVMLRALEEHHLLQTMTGKISIGWLIVEDVAMVLAMVMIPALASAGGAEGADHKAIGMQLLTAFGKVGLFAVIMIVAGKRFLPWLLTAVSRTGSRELFTLAAISSAMGIAFASALLFGVSLALGAFFAGMMIRESDLNHEVADRVLPFQDAFAVLFFVAVGMLFNPAILIQKPVEILITVAIIVLGKGFITFATVRLFGYTAKTSLLIAAGLAQIGEFSFILIALGMSVGLLTDEVRNLILAGALISIALNPVIFSSMRNWCVRRGMTQRGAEDDRLAHLAQDEQRDLKNFIILIGAGRVGETVTKLMDFTSFNLVAVDENREKVENLRKNGVHAIAGDATERETLIEAQIEKAHAVLITVPDPFDARRIVELVKSIKPNVRVFVRSHNDEETAFLQSQHVELTVSATEEIARRMVNRLAHA
jgi:CPA2 family monovalent cation:H+ antiporter-2